MSDDEIPTGPRPFRDDAERETVEAMIDMEGPPWLLLTDGEHHTAAAEIFNTDGGTETVVLLELPVRPNHGAPETATVSRIMLSPEDAVAIAMSMLHTAKWLQARRIMGN